MRQVPNVGEYVRFPAVRFGVSDDLLAAVVGEVCRVTWTSPNSAVVELREVSDAYKASYPG